MRILCVDDEKPALGNLIMKLTGLPGVDSVAGFQTAETALDHIRREPPDIAFLDVNMPGVDGMALAERIQALHPETHIVFVTGYSEYAVDAFRMHASGYVMKPAGVDELRAELAHVRSLLPKRAQSRIRVQCFGNFDVFIDEAPVRFARSKAKELFAYLVCRKGAACSTREVAAVLFEEEAYDTARLNYLQKIISSMKKAFEAVEDGDALFPRHYNELSLHAELLDCDYFRFLKGDPDAVNAYAGEFMAQYSWAESMCGRLDRMKRG